MNGTIKKLISEKGFGFITPEGADKDLFFHSSELVDVSFGDLKEGDQVTFEEGQSNDGRPNATKVQKA